ncbi:unnamed protein product, partial [Eruca vesicaria subsp. sativa]|nr:unnamed protein product [Eruca vesicaria subsp. sativa]
MLVPPLILQLCLLRSCLMPTVSYLSPDAGSNTKGLGVEESKATRALTSVYHNNQTNAPNINSLVAVSCSTH